MKSSLSEQHTFSLDYQVTIKPGLEVILFLHNDFAFFCSHLLVTVTIEIS